jgi:hypothetical protein
MIAFANLRHARSRSKDDAAAFVSEEMRQVFVRTFGA